MKITSISLVITMCCVLFSFESHESVDYCKLFKEDGILIDTAKINDINRKLNNGYKFNRFYSNTYIVKSCYICFRGKARDDKYDYLVYYFGNANNIDTSVVLAESLTNQSLKSKKSHYYFANVYATYLDSSCLVINQQYKMVDFDTFSFKPAPWLFKYSKIDTIIINYK